MNVLFACLTILYELRHLASQSLAALSNAHTAKIQHFRDMAGVGGGHVLNMMHGGSRMAIDPRISTKPGRGTLDFHQTGVVGGGGGNNKLYVCPL